MTLEEWVELRAALIQLAKALETERACILRINKIVERTLEDAKIEKVEANSCL